MDYKYLARPLKEYIENLSKKTPCPGGGSASILSLALSNALILMVCNFSMESKKVNQDSRKIVKEIFDQATKIQPLLNISIEKDSTIYHEIQENAKEMKKNPAVKKDDYISSLKKSIDLHMEMIVYCEKILNWDETLIENSNPFLISDVGVSASLAEGTVYALAINVMVNLFQIDDENYRTEILNKLERLTCSLKNKAREIIMKVEKILKTS